MAALFSHTLLLTLAVRAADREAVAAQGRATRWYRREVIKARARALDRQGRSATYIRALGDPHTADVYMWYSTVNYITVL